MSIMEQHDLFGAIEPALPNGFRCIPRMSSRRSAAGPSGNDARAAVRGIRFHGFEGRRRTVSYGWKYDFDTQRVRKGNDIPSFLLPVRALAGSFAGIDPDRLEQALVTEYGAGAPIGWHKDKSVFGRVVGILAFLLTCTFRLGKATPRRQVGSAARLFSNLDRHT